MPGFNPGITVFEPSPSNIVGVHGLEREHPARSKMLTYAGAVTSGVLAALALQIYLSGAGFDFGALWDNLLSAKPRELRTTGPWWAMAGMAFVVSGATAAALVRLPFPWRRFRPLRWGLGGLIVLLLGHIGHTDSAGSHALGLGADLAVRLTALGLAALIAMFGAYLAARG